jgi:hypothetical protein
MSVNMIVEKALINQETIQPYYLRDFAFSFFMEEIFFDNVMTSRSNGSSKKSAEICRLTVLTFCIDQILKKKA